MDRFKSTHIIHTHKNKNNFLKDKCFTSKRKTVAVERLLGWLVSQRRGRNRKWEDGFVTGKEAASCGEVQQWTEGKSVLSNSLQHVFIYVYKIHDNFQLVNVFCKMYFILL